VRENLLVVIDDFSMINQTKVSFSIQSRKNWALGTDD
jgi:hypothetical protein